MGPSRVDVEWSTVVDAPVGDVWKLIRNFNDIKSWLGVPTTIEGGGPDNQVGATIRVIPLGPGQLRELLVAHSDEDHYMSYRILMTEDDKAKNPFPGPIENYIGTLKLTEIKDGNRTFAHWAVKFWTDADKTELLAQVINGGVTQGGLEKLRDHFAKK
ncbi:polyketide cyclase/dehydrase [Hyaloraphidium curvatum]|nr:polyketide cyclase/dehydrase [Hyaloraphidium curvatum]